MTIPDNTTFRLAQTAFTVSYSTALFGSVGLVGGKGDGSSDSTSSSESEPYSEASSPDSDDDEESIDDGESTVDVPFEPTECGREVEDLAEILNFLSSGSRAGGQGPVPFSTKRMSTYLYDIRISHGVLTLMDKPYYLITRSPTIVFRNIGC